MKYTFNVTVVVEGFDDENAARYYVEHGLHGMHTKAIDDIITLRKNEPEND